MERRLLNSMLPEAIQTNCFDQVPAMTGLRRLQDCPRKREVCL